MHRGEFESAHSVVLAIFSSHSKQVVKHTSLRSDDPLALDSTFVERMVPFYLQCLLEVKPFTRALESISQSYRTPRMED